MEWFAALSGWEQALIATSFTYIMTALGAALVFFCKGVGKTAFCFMLSSAAGIMLASSFFSLLLPAVESGGENSYIVLSSGFVAGGLLIIVCDFALSGCGGGRIGSSGGSASLCIAVTVHNIPEGLAIGVAFGALGAGGSVVSAIMLAVGVGIQNFPEGMCIAFPLRAGGMGRAKSFFFGQLSGFVEVISGAIGALAASALGGVLPFALAFSAGAMVAVVCSELIVESFSTDKIKATLGITLGFALMMILDLAF